MKSILITGVSSGIGYGSAKAFVNKGYRVFGSVRKESDGVRVREELGESFHPLLFDVTDSDGIRCAVQEVGELLGGKNLGGLINNAGVNLSGPLMHQSMDDIRHQFEVNVFGLIEVTQAFLPMLGARPAPSGVPGRVINISSVGGQIAAPFIGAYAATKHAVEGLSHSWRRELMMYGIDLIIVGPGAVKSEIWTKHRAGEPLPEAADAYRPAMDLFEKFAMDTASKGFAVDDFGRMILRVFEAKKPRVRYALVPQKFSNWTMPRLLPARLIDRVIGKQMGLLPPQTTN